MVKLGNEYGKFIYGYKGLFMSEDITVSVHEFLQRYSYLYKKEKCDDQIWKHSIN